MSGEKRNTPSGYTRRDVLRGAAALALSSQLPGCSTPPPSGRPNVLFVFSDAHRASTMGCYGNRVVQTPQFDRFAAQALQLDTAMSNTPLCRPFRAALMSGRFGHHNGMVGNISEHNHRVVPDPDWKPGQWRPDSRCFGETFAAAGYRCGYVGKWHLGQPNVGAGKLRLGFDDFWAAAGVFTHDYYEWNYYTDKDVKVSGEGMFRPRMEADLALDFIRDAGADPWLLMLSWGPPHEPLEPPEEFRHYGGMKLPRNLPRSRRTKTLVNKLELYYGLVEALDHEFGRLMDELASLGVADNTIVVYTSDHGTMLGSQGLQGKEQPFSESTRVPFLVRWPGHTPAGVREGMPFGTPDILPTLAGLASVPVEQELDGRDFSGVFLGRSGAPRQQSTLLTAPDAKPVPYPGWRGVRTEDVLYARREAGPWLLYDVKNDPHELENLVDSRPDLLAEIDELTRDLMQRHGDRWRTD